MTEELFFDTDCLSSFMWVNNTNILVELYGGRIILPDPVYQEICNPCVPHLKKCADEMIEKKEVSVKTIEVETEEYNIYRELINGEKGHKGIGKGEASAIAMAKVYNGIIASNNYKDIAFYVKKYNLKHVDTGMILIEALEKRLITEVQGNEIWSKMLARKRLLPTKTFTEYLNSK